MGEKDMESMSQIFNAHPISAEDDFAQITSSIQLYINQSIVPIAINCNQLIVHTLET